MGLTSFVINPSLLQRAIRVRHRTLLLGGLNDYYLSSSAPSSSTLVAAAPETTNLFILAYGEKEGLAPGERLEVYGTTLCLVRTMAFGCPRNLGRRSSFTRGALTRNCLDDIAHEMQVMLQRRLLVMNKRDADASSSQPQAEQKLVLKRHIAVDMDEADHITAEEAGELARRLANSNKEVVVAEWEVESPAAAATRVRPPWASQHQHQHQHHQSNGNSNTSANANSARRRDEEDEEEEDRELLVENGVYFASHERSGLRALRSSRLAFMSCVERTATYLRQRQHKQARADEYRRPLAVLDVSEMDFSFTQAALQSTIELGLRSESQCHISYVPLTSEAAAAVDPQCATFTRLVMEAPGKALPNPLESLSPYSFDVGAYTAYLDLPLPSGRRVHSKAAAVPPPSSHRRPKDARRETTEQLSRALSSLRQKGNMIITFVPTPASVAAVHKETSNERRAEVAMEYATVNEAKALVAEAIAKTGRWGYITDEVLPAVDCPQGSAITLTVTLD